MVGLTSLPVGLPTSLPVGFPTFPTLGFRGFPVIFGFKGFKDGSAEGWFVPVTFADSLRFSGMTGFVCFGFNVTLRAGFPSSIRGLGAGGKEACVGFGLCIGGVGACASGTDGTGGRFWLEIVVILRGIPPV